MIVRKSVVSYTAVVVLSHNAPSQEGKEEEEELCVTASYFHRRLERVQY